MPLTYARPSQPAYQPESPRNDAESKESLVKRTTASSSAPSYPSNSGGWVLFAKRNLTAIGMGVGVILLVGTGSLEVKLHVGQPSSSYPGNENEPYLAPEPTYSPEVFVTEPAVAPTEETPAAAEEPAAAEPAPETPAAEGPAAEEPAAAEPAAEPAAPAEPAATPAIEVAVSDEVRRRRPLAQWSDTYLRRTNRDAAKLTEDWGAWTHVDPKRADRPVLDYTKYPNRDMPRADFPQGAWQTDKDYLATFLPAASALVDRGLNAILAEYGKSPQQMPNATLEEREFMFHLDGPEVPFNRKHPPGNGGRINDFAVQDLQRSLLHAIMTEDKWIFAMGGHSSAAGHGNYFQQSYTMQVQKLLEPVLARLGVYHVAHNFGMGGLGTIHNSIGMKSIYGDEIDVLVWDSSMTENWGLPQDVFARQALLSGKRVPVLWGSLDAFHYAGWADAGSGFTTYWHAGIGGVPTAKSMDEVRNMPWALQYIECDGEIAAACKNNKYSTKTCWIERDDVTNVPKQAGEPGGKARWHPGNRQHLLSSRLISYNILKQLQAALKKWQEAPDFALPDEAWHVTTRYESVREKVLNRQSGPCFDYNLTQFPCNVPVQAATEFTPRFRPYETSIRNIMKVGTGEDAGKVKPAPLMNIYDPPDVHNQYLDIPAEAIDVVAVVENGVDFVPNLARKKEVDDLVHWTPPQLPPLVNPTEIQPGLGWSYDGAASPDNCDGTYDSFCNRGPKDDCMLYGHNDKRGALKGDSFSGWLVVHLAQVKHGFVMITMDPNFPAGANPRTDKWTCENNKCDGRRELLEQQPDKRPSSSLRGLQDENKCPEFKFQFALDGVITTWDWKKFKEMEHPVARTVTTFELLADENYTGGETKDVELAIRVTGCARQMTFALSHIYWA